MAGALAAAATLALLAASTAAAQRIDAVPLDRPPRLDGRLTEEVWRTAPALTGLTQREPDEGAPALDSTEVRFAFDDDALWIGARMFHRDPSRSHAPVTRRDRETSAEQIVISLDTHLDRRTAYSLSVTPAGVRIDWHHPSDDEDDRDFTWDPVWEARTRIDSLGWTAEMRIPFSQLRFARGAEQRWGVNVVRRVPARNEESYWILVGRTEPGWSSRMGTLAGIRGIRPARRVELVPYIAADASIAHDPDPVDPFTRAREERIRGGADAKIGIASNLTLDIALNPDFGQVEADPAEVNLSAYETFFDERRPFFLERAELFGDRDLFYSRRIGARPPVQPDADFVESRENSTILGAARLTGRLASGTSVAALAALTDREVVATFDTTLNRFTDALVGPRTLYAVASAQQELGRERSTVSVMATAVHRDLEDDPALAAAVSRAAYSGIVETRLRWAGGAYDASAYAGATHVAGDPAAILRQQLSSRRYWQRPDASHVGVDPARRSLTGATAGINHSKLAGRWRWDLDYWQESPGLEPNDLGAVEDVDNRVLSADLRYRDPDPGRWLRAWETGIEAQGEWNFERVRTGEEYTAFYNATFLNFWRLNTDFEYAPRALSDAMTRGGPLMQTGEEVDVTVELQNRSGARNRWGIEVAADGGEFGARRRGVELSLSFRPGDRWELSVDPEYDAFVDPRQYVTTLAGGRTETYGQRYIFARVERHEVSLRFRLNYTFTPDLTLETYAEPFASSGRYSRLGELRAPRSAMLREYGTDGTTIVRNADGSHEVTADGDRFTLEAEDFNVRSFRSNVVLRWEWLPGSSMYLVWQQDHEADRALRTVRPGDLWDALRTSGDSFLAFKVSYWLPVR